MRARLTVAVVAALMLTGCGLDWGKIIDDLLKPKPSPSPTAEPSPTPDPTPTPTPDPTPTPPPELPPGLITKINAKVHGQGFDSTVVTVNAWDYCASIGLGTYPDGTKRGECPLLPEGHPKRLALELNTLGGCPVWEGRCYSDTPEHSYECPVTFHHYGHDDPQTSAYEGSPVECSAQRDAHGDPAAGFWVVASGRGQVRACAPNQAVRCSAWVDVNH